MSRPIPTALLLVTATLVAPLCADEPEPLAAGIGQAAEWKLDRIRLRSGEVREGLIEKEAGGTIRFLEIRRPEGRGMFGVYQPIDRDQIASIERLSPHDRRLSLERFDQFRNRARAEAGKMSDVELVPVGEQGSGGWRFVGRWFTLESTADEPITRRAIVRVEQVFTAYRQMMPPRTTPTRPLRILLFGSTAQYRTFLQRIGLPVENAAFFSTEWNMVVAASDLDRLSSALAEIRSEHDRLRDKLAELQKQLPERLREKSEQLAALARPEAARRKALLAFKRQYEQELDENQRALDTFDRKNETLFAEQTRQLFATLYHEAFHAYLENFVYPHTQFDVPRWLNEGLAQVFEAGLLEAGTLRVDAPNRDALRLLQESLEAEDSPSLADVLAADHRQFLALHGNTGALAARHYAYSWGLAYYLAFEQPLLGTPVLHAFVSPAAATLPPAARFEQLTGRSLAAFEADWRQAMQKLKPSQNQ